MNTNDSPPPLVRLKNGNEKPKQEETLPDFSIEGLLTGGDASMPSTKTTYIGQKKPAAKKTGLGAKKGLGATRISSVNQFRYFVDCDASTQGYKGDFSQKFYNLKMK